VIGEGPVVPPPPAVLTGLALTPAAVSPNGDGFGDVATVSYTLGARAAVTAEIKDASGAVVATRFTNQKQSARQIAFPLTVDQLADGTYVLSVRAIAEDGREAAAEVPFLVDRTLSSLTASPSPLSPNGGTIAFSFVLAKPAQVTVTVFQAGVPLAVVFEGLLQPGSQSVPWGGQLSGGPAPAGHYDVVVTAADDIGQLSQSAGFDVASLGG
jgi:hypothetical protein